MSDPEKLLRARAIERLSVVCDCEEEVSAHKIETHVAGCASMVRLDVLCRPREPTLRHVTIAIEVKQGSPMGDAKFARWVKQAADYVGTVPGNGWPMTVAAFVWLPDVELHPDPGEQLRIAGMIQLAQHFRVGHAHEHPQRRGRLSLTFGPSADIYREGHGWTTKALELLTAKRTFGGTRRGI